MENVLTDDGQARPAFGTKAWLTPLLNRVSISTLFISLLNEMQLCEAGDVAVLEAAEKSLLRVWPLASPRMNLDTLTNCFTSVLTLMAGNRDLAAAIPTLLSAVVRSFRQACGNASNKKKVRRDASYAFRMLIP